MEDMKDFMAEIDAAMETLQPGDLLEGRVMAIQEDGVVVSLGYVNDGMIPRSDFTKDRKEPLTDYCEVGAAIQVIVTELRESEGLVMLSASQAAKQVAWHDFSQSLEQGKTLVVEITDAVKGAYPQSTAAFGALFPPPGWGPGPWGTSPPWWADPCRCGLSSWTRERTGWSSPAGSWLRPNRPS